MPRIEEMNHEQLLAFATKLKDEYNITHNELAWIAAELAWATDGTLSAVVRHVKELVSRRNETIEAKNAEIADLKREVKDLKEQNQQFKDENESLNIAYQAANNIIARNLRDIPDVLAAARLSDDKAEDALRKGRMINSAFNHIRSIVDDESMDDDVRLTVIREVMSKYPRIPSEGWLKKRI